MNEQDKEMIHLAAKAAGIECLWELGWRLPCGQTISWWNPLDDDGDAFRLAVKLGMIIGSYANYSTVDLLQPNDCVETITVWHSEAENNAETATRRAIVRAGAEMGKGLFPVPVPGELPEDNYEVTEDHAYWHDDWPEY